MYLENKKEFFFHNLSKKHVAYTIYEPLDST